MNKNFIEGVHISFPTELATLTSVFHRQKGLPPILKGIKNWLFIQQDLLVDFIPSKIMSFSDSGNKNMR